LFFLTAVIVAIQEEVEKLLKKGGVNCAWVLGKLEKEREMKSTILLALILVVGQNAGANLTQEHLIVPGVSAGGFILGPNGAQQLRNIKPDRIDRGMSQTRQAWKRFLAGRVIYYTFFIHTVSNGAIDAQPADGVTIDLIWCSGLGFHTANGIMAGGGTLLGSSLDDIRKVFPDIAPVDGTPTIFDDVKQGIAFEFPEVPTGKSRCMAIMVHPRGQSNIATQEQVAELLAHGNKE
jgi:hypothetical protein